MAIAFGTINNLDTAITSLATFHETNLVRPSKLASKIVSDDFFSNAMRQLKNDTYLSSIIKDNQLPSHLIEKLISGFQSYTDKINQIFNRNFAHHTSLVLAVDPIACGANGGVLTHERIDFGKKMMTKAITGGGLVDAKEKALEAAYREFDEESGGCKLANCRLALVVDGVRSNKPYFMSCAFKADFSGQPLSNHEATVFEQIPHEKIADYQWFSDHATIVQDVLDLEQGKNSYPGKGIPYSSKSSSFDSHIASKSFKPLLTDSKALVHVTKAIERVNGVYAKFAELFDKEFVSKLDKRSLDLSCNEIGHGWEKEVIDITPNVSALRKAWNDDKRLWDFLGPIKLAAIEISDLFGTFVNTGEGGVIEMAPLYISESQVFLKEIDGKLLLHRELLTQFRNFKDSLHHHAHENGVELKPTNLPMLTSLYEDPACQYKEGIRSRIFGFIIDISEGRAIPSGTTPHAITELREQPIEAWASIHDYNIFQEISSFSFSWLIKDLP